MLEGGEVKAGYVRKVLVWKGGTMPMKTRAGAPSLPLCPERIA